MVREEGNETKADERGSRSGWWADVPEEGAALSEWPRAGRVVDGHVAVRDLKDLRGPVLALLPSSGRRSWVESSTASPTSPGAITPTSPSPTT